jgi:hypothetical protein
LSVQHLGFFEGITHVLGGKGWLRLIIQPSVAVLLGIRLGIADARAHEPPFVARLFRSRHHLLRRALSDVAIPMCVAIAVDGLLQHYTLGYVRPLAAVLVAVLIVWVPFALARAIANRVASASTRDSSNAGTAT